MAPVLPMALGVVAFTGIVVALALFIIAARSVLVPAGNIKITINNDPDKAIDVPAGGANARHRHSDAVFS